MPLARPQVLENALEATMQAKNDAEESSARKVLADKSLVDARDAAGKSIEAASAAADAAEADLQTKVVTLDQKRGHLDAIQDSYFKLGGVVSPTP